MYGKLFQIDPAQRPTSGDTKMFVISKYIYSLFFLDHCVRYATTQHLLHIIWGLIDVLNGRAEAPFSVGIGVQHLPSYPQSRRQLNLYQSSPIFALSTAKQSTQYFFVWCVMHKIIHHLSHKPGIGQCVCQTKPLCSVLYNILIFNIYICQADMCVLCHLHL